MTQFTRAVLRAPPAPPDAKVASSALFEDPVASEEWDAKKHYILNRFAVQGNITVNATFDIVGRAKRGCAVAAVDTRTHGTRRTAF